MIKSIAKPATKGNSWVAAVTRGGCDLNAAPDTLVAWQEAAATTWWFDAIAWLADRDRVPLTATYSQDAAWPEAELQDASYLIVVAT